MNNPTEYEMMKARRSQPLLWYNPQYINYQCDLPVFVPSDKQCIRQDVPVKVHGMTDKEHDKQMQKFYRILGRTVAMTIGLTEQSWKEPCVEFIVMRWPDESR